jgi:hypothetical protein
MKQQKTLLALALIAGATVASTAQASLFDRGNGLIYDDVTNITWSADGNLLSTLETSMGFLNVVNAIIAASPSINDTANSRDTPANSGHYNVTRNDFGSGGSVSWFGAKAFMTYLNTINYAGSNQWDLPTAGSNPQEGYNQTNDPFGELFYNELGGTAGNFMPDTSYFINEHGFFWTSTESATVWGDNIDAWRFQTINGFLSIDGKPNGYGAWATHSGDVAAVPVPGAVWLFGSGLFGLLGFKKRKAV